MITDMTETTLEIIVGTYENFLLGYSLTNTGGTGDEQKYSLTPSFTNNSHCGTVRSICSVRKYIASGSSDEVIRLLNLDSRTEHGTLQHHTGTITCLASFHNYLFSGSDDGSICIWLTGNWECQKTLNGHDGGVIGISIHPTGKLALSIGQDRSLKTWNLVKGRLGYITNLKGIADAIQWSSDGNFYAVSIASRLDVYSLASAQVVYTIPFGKRIWHVVFLTDTVVAVAGDTDTVQVHDVSTGIHLTTFTAHKTRVKDMKYHQSQQLLVTTSNSDEFIKVWKFPQNKFSQPPTLLVEFNTTCRVICLALWDKSLVPSKKGTEADAVDTEILQEDEDVTEEMDADDGGESEEDPVLPEPPRKTKKAKPKVLSEPTQSDFREHKKQKRVKRK